MLHQCNLIDYEGVREALTVFESYEGPANYAPHPRLIQLMRSLLVSHDRHFIAGNTQQSLNASHSIDWKVNHSLQGLECMKDDGEKPNRIKRDIVLLHLDDYIEQSTPANKYYPQTDMEIIEEITPTQNPIMIQRNTMGGRAWLSSKKPRGGRRKKGYINRKKRRRNTTDTLTSHNLCNHHQIPSSISIDRNGDGDSFAFHSQSSMTADN